MFLLDLEVREITGTIVGTLCGGAPSSARQGKREHFQCLAHDYRRLKVLSLEPQGRGGKGLDRSLQKRVNGFAALVRSTGSIRHRAAVTDADRAARTQTSPGTSSSVGTCSRLEIRVVAALHDVRPLPAPLDEARWRARRARRSCARTPRGCGCESIQRGERVDHRPLVERPVGEVRIDEDRSRARRASAASAKAARIASRNSVREAIGLDAVGQSSWSPRRRSGSAHAPAGTQPAAASSSRACGARAADALRVQPARVGEAAHECRITAAGPERLAVDEDEARRRRACGVRRSSAIAAAEHGGDSARSNQVPGLGSLSTSPSARDAATRSASRRSSAAAREALQRRGDARRPIRYAARSGVAIARPVGRSASASIACRLGEPLRATSAASSARAGARKPIEAVMHSPTRDAVVAPARRQVEHVAGLEQPLLARREVGEHLQRHVVAQARARARGRSASAAARRPAAGTRRTNRRAGRRRRRRSHTST